MVSSSRARARRRLRPRPAASLLLVAAVLAAAPLLGQAFRLPWGAHRQPQPQQPQRPPQPSLAPIGAQQQQRGSPVVMFAKPKKGPKGLDAAKAAGTCVRSL